MDEASYPAAATFFRCCETEIRRHAALQVSIASQLSAARRVNLTSAAQTLQRFVSPFRATRFFGSVFNFIARFRTPITSFDAPDAGLDSRKSRYKVSVAAPKPALERPAGEHCINHSRDWPSALR